MKIYKPLTRWWSKTHGGEHKAHVDFVVEAGEPISLALARVFGNAPDSFWLRVVPEGKAFKVHLTMSIYEDDL